MASFFYTLHYMSNLYVGIREKFYGCSGGYAARVRPNRRTSSCTVKPEEHVVHTLNVSPVLCPSRFLTV